MGGGNKGRGKGDGKSGFTPTQQHAVNYASTHLPRMTSSAAVKALEQRGGNLTHFKAFVDDQKMTLAKSEATAARHAEARTRLEQEQAAQAAREKARHHASRSGDAIALSAMLSRKSADGIANIDLLRELFTLTHDDALADKVAGQKENPNGPVHWSPIPSIDPPYWWRMLAVARRWPTHKPTWDVFADSPDPYAIKHFDCLFFNSGRTCTNTAHNHLEYHRCMLCSGRHPLHCTALEDLSGAEREPCRVWKLAAQAFSAFCTRFFAPLTDRRSVARVLLGDEDAFTFYDMGLYKSKLAELDGASSAPPTRVPAAGERGPEATRPAPVSPPMSRQPTIADHDDGDAAATEGPDDARDVEAADDEAYYELADSVAETDIQLFDTTPFTMLYNRLHKPPTVENCVGRHSFCWYPSRPAVRHPFLLWCDAACCRMGTGGTNQTVQKAEYFPIPQPANPDDSRVEAVVKRFTNQVTQIVNGKARDKGFTNEVSAFSNLYQREYLLSNEAYSFDDTAPIALIATRRHTWDLAKELEADKTIALALADDKDEARIRAVELRRLVRVRQLLLEVSTMHESLLHGDIKPMNIVLAKAVGNEPERMLLIDFEFARSVDAAATNGGMSVSGHTPFWASPSQTVASLPKSRADDLFALALVLYEIMAAPITKEEAERPLSFPDEPHAPLFWQHLVEELPQRPLKLAHFLTRLKLAENIEQLSWEFCAPPIPKRCHALVEPLVAKLLTAWADGKTKEHRRDLEDRRATGSQPLPRVAGDRFAFRKELLTAEAGSLCLMLLRLQQQLHNAEGHAAHMKLNAMLRTSKHAYFRNLPRALVTMIGECKKSFAVSRCSARDEEKILSADAATFFDPTAELRLFYALTELRNTIAHALLSPADCMGAVMWQCPLIIVHLQAHLDAVAAEVAPSAAAVEIFAVDDRSLSILAYN
jgi:hypothetical protein